MSTQTPPTPSPEALARQLRALKAVVTALVLALALGTGYYLFQRRQGQPVTILIGGQPISTVRNIATANQILTDAERAKIGAAFAVQTPIRLQKIQFQRAPSDAPMDADAVARQKLAHVLKLRVHAFVIVVNGKPSVGLPTAQAAQETLDLVKDHFAEMPPQAKILDEPQIVEKTVIAPKVIDTARARTSAAAAAPYFWTPPPSKPYVVQRGDTGFRIAARNHIAFADFLGANPGQDLNKLKPGDTVNVQKMPLLLSVRVRKTFTQDEAVIANVPASEAGKQQVTYVVTYLDGQEIRRDVSSTAVLEKPRTQMAL